MNDDSSQAGPCGEVSTFAARSMVSPGLQAVLKASTDARFGPLMADVSKAFLGVGLPRPELGGFAKLAAGPMVRPRLQAALKATTDARYRPLMADLSKSVLGAAMPKGVLGDGVSKAVLADFGKPPAGPMVSPGLQAALKASTDAAVRPLMADVTNAFLGAGRPKVVLGDFAKLAARPVFNAAIDVPAGRTLSERARFTDLLGQAAKQWPAGADGQAALADLAQREAERQAAAHEADQAIVEVRDQFEQLVTIMQLAQQDQWLEARVNRRLAIATLAATILLALLSYLLPPRSATTHQPQRRRLPA
jgi:hypothetical protein